MSETNQDNVWLEGETHTAHILFVDTGEIERENVWRCEKTIFDGMYYTSVKATPPHFIPESKQ